MMLLNEGALTGDVAVIGASGFVGTNLRRELASVGATVVCLGSESTDNDFAMARCDLAFVAAPHARKWWANAHPAADKRIVDELLRKLSLLKARSIVHYSTIDVFPVLNGVDESVDCSPVEHAYGKHRLYLERSIASIFSNTTIIRLPGLFGNQLAKNVIYDLLNQRMLEDISPRSSYQWYDISDLLSDTLLALTLPGGLVAFNSEPITNRELVAAVFPELQNLLPKFREPESESFVSYNIHSRFAEFWSGGEGPFMRDREVVLERIRQFKGGAQNG